MRGRFKDTIADLAMQDDKVVVILGDVSVYMFMPFKERHPDRFYNMGICENTLISVAAGLAAQGYRPYVHTIAPFLTERSLEQIKLDACYNRFPVNIVSCGATFDYAWDGATHHAYLDLAALRLLPGMEVYQPGSDNELEALLRARHGSPNSCYFRLSDYPHKVDVPFAPGKAQVLKDSGARLTVMTAGPLLGNVLEACQDLPVNLVYFHCLKPIDTETIARFRDTEILVVQDAHGLKEAIQEVPRLQVGLHGLPDAFYGGYGKVADARASVGLDPAGIRAKVQERLAAA